MKKFELTKEMKKYNGHVLHRIKALVNIPEHGVRKGDLGGWIEREENLQENAWVSYEAMIFGNAKVFGDAWVYDAKVFGDVMVYGNARVYGDAHVSGDARVSGNAEVFDNAKVYGDAWVSDNAKVFGNAKVSGDAWVSGKAEIYGDAVITSNRDYIVFKNFWSSGRYFTWTRSNDMWAVGCFYGTGRELIKKAYQDSEESGNEYEEVVRYVENVLKRHPER